MASSEQVALLMLCEREEETNEIPPFEPRSERTAIHLGEGSVPFTCCSHSAGARARRRTFRRLSAVIGLVR